MWIGGAIDELSLICADNNVKLVYEDNGSLLPIQILGNASDDIHCPAGEFATDIYGSSIGGNKGFVSALGLRCKAVGSGGDGQRVPPKGLVGGAESTATCGNGEFLRGITGNARQTVNWVRALCSNTAHVSAIVGSLPSWSSWNNFKVHCPSGFGFVQLMSI